jgi:hypothetical protein
VCKARVEASAEGRGQAGRVRDVSTHWKNWLSCPLAVLFSLSELSAHRISEVALFGYFTITVGGFFRITPKRREGREGLPFGLLEEGPSWQFASDVHAESNAHTTPLCSTSSLGKVGAAAPVAEGGHGSVRRS